MCKLHIPVRHPVGDVRGAVQYVSLEYRKRLEILGVFREGAKDHDMVW